MPPPDKAEVKDSGTRNVARTSQRVVFTGGSGFELAGIIDRPDPFELHPVAVFSHCFTCNKDLKAITRISRGLADRGIAVLRFDMTGLGGSKGDFSRTNFSTNLADLRAAIEFAQRELGRVSALIGHSFGGAAALATAGSLGAAGIDSVGAVVTLAAPSDTHHLARLLAKMDPTIEATGVGTVLIGGFRWPIRKEMLEDFASHDLAERVAQIRSPTLLLHSPVDETVDIEHAHRLLDWIQSAGHGTPVSLVALDRADHLLVQQASDINFVADVTAAFVKRYGQVKPNED